MSIRDFISWWISQLSELIPARVRRSLHGGRTTVSLAIEGDTVRFSDQSGDSTVSCALSTEDHPLRPPALDAFLANLSRSPQRLRVILAPNQFLVRTLTLPRAARPHLAEAIGYQLPKLTPFSVDQVLYACGVTPEGPPDGPLTVWLVAIPKRDLIKALSLIGQTAPPNPLRLAQRPETGKPLALSWGVSEGQTRSSRRIRVAWAGMLVAWVSACALHLYNRYEARTQLYETLAESQIEARKVGALRERITDTEAQLQWLAERKRSTPSMVYTLEILAQVMDDQTWLQRFTFDGDKLSLTGVSSTPTDLVEKLEKSSAFEGVRFDAFTRDRRSQADRFNLSARVEVAGAGEGG